MKTIFLLAPGINNWGSIFGDWQDWPIQFSAQINVDTPYTAQSFHYFTTPLTVWVNQRRRSLSFSRMLREYTCRDWCVHLVGHSNGARVVLDGMRLAGWPKVASVNLVCGACDSDWERNGLNTAMRRGCVGAVHCYRADNDMAMQVEDTAIGLMLFGIGWNDMPLGLSGPRNVDPALSGRVTEHHWPDYGHSTCWTKGELSQTIGQILDNILSPCPIV